MICRFATAAGLVLWGNKYSTGSGAQLGDVFKNILSNKSVVNVRKWLKSFLP